MRSLLALLIRFYRLAISPMMAPRCRYFPSCSDYALEAIERHGAWCGGWLAIRRLGRCHPWHPGGVDEVPDRVARIGPFCRCASSQRLFSDD